MAPAVFGHLVINLLSRLRAGPRGFAMGGGLDLRGGGIGPVGSDAFQRLQLPCRKIFLQLKLPFSVIRRC